MSNNAQCLITGGAGFIGSHLADKLLANGGKVTVLDNLSSGKIDNINHNLKNPDFKFVKKNLSSVDDIKGALEEQEVVFHLAAYSSVYVEETGINALYQQNIGNTIKLLEGIRKSSSVKKIIFTSSSTIYGYASLLPTPEDYGPLVPESHYGASKLACEALVSTYCKQYGISGIILRLANIVGARSDKGIIYDFIRKLKANPNKLIILGNGFQSKSYLHISDFTNCLYHVHISKLGGEKIDNNVIIFNVGNIDQINAVSIAKEICTIQNLNEVMLSFQDGMGGGGWKGDITQMLLDITKLKNTGWAPRYNSREAIIISAKELIRELLPTQL
jgi:UDP-glucose 4-epimerase